MGFAVDLIAAKSQAAPLLGSIRLLMWTIDRECVMSTGMSFFGDLAAERRLGGSGICFWIVRLERRWQLTDASLLVGPGAVWDWLGLNQRVMLISILSCVPVSQRRAEWGPEVVWHQPNKKNCIRIFAFPDLFISLLLFYVGTKLSSWVGHRAYRFPWDCLICPPLQKGEAVQSFHCFLLPQPGSHMTWHDPKLIWIPVTPMAAFFIRSLCFMPLFSSSVELPPSGGALSAFLACWGVKKKDKTKPLSWSQLVDVFHLEFVSLSHSVFIHSPPIWLGQRRAEEKPSTNIFLFHSKSTRTRDTLPSWQPWDCGRRGLCDGGRPAGNALNTPTVLQRRGAGKGEAWENTEASKQQPVTRSTTHTLHYCPDTITIHKGEKVPLTGPDTPKKRPTIKKE